MRIAVEREQAPGVERVTRELVVDVLTMPVAVQLDGDPALRRDLEDARPVGGHAGTAVEYTPARMAENRHAARPHRREHSGRLIVRPPQHGMRRGHDELERLP